MRDYKEVKKTVSEVSSITCNKCGTTKPIFSPKDPKYKWNEDLFHSFESHFGYGSNFDEEHWKFDLCEDCLVEFVETFIHKPEGYKKYI